MPSALHPTPLPNAPLTLNKVFIKLTPYMFNKDEIDVLKLGLSFCPTTKFYKYDTFKDVYLHANEHLNINLTLTV